MPYFKRPEKTAGEGESRVGGLAELVSSWAGEERGE